MYCTCNSFKIHYSLSGLGVCIIHVCVSLTNAKPGLVLHRQAESVQASRSIPQDHLSYFYYSLHAFVLPGKWIVGYSNRKRAEKKTWGRETEVLCVYVHIARQG